MSTFAEGAVNIAAAGGSAYATLQFIGSIGIGLVFVAFGIFAIYSTYNAPVETAEQIEQKKLLNENYKPQSKSGGYVVGSILLVLGIGIPVYGYYRMKLVKSSKATSAVYGAMAGTRAIAGAIQGPRKSRRRRRSRKRKAMRRSRSI